MIPDNDFRPPHEERAKPAAASTKAIIDELTFRSYVHNRMMFPEIEPERWTLVFSNVPEMERRYLITFVLKLIEAAEEEGACGHA